MPIDSKSRMNPNDIPCDAGNPELDVDARLLHSAYQQLPLSLALTLVATIACGGLLWPYFPTPPMQVWMAAILASAAARLVLWAAFNNAVPAPAALGRWRQLFFAGSVAAGAAWAVGPALMISQLGGAQPALLVGLLLSVCAVVASAQAAQQAAMYAFLVTALLPPGAVAWHQGGDFGRMIALAVMTGLASVMIVGRRSSQARRVLLETQSRMQGIMDAALDAVIGIDDRGRITAWNQRAEAIFGWSTAEALGLAFPDAILSR